MVHDHKFGFKYHSKLVEMGADGKPQLLADENVFDDIYQNEKAKIDHLQAKTFAQMRRQTGLYVIKDNKGLDEGDIRRGLSHLLRGSLPTFAPYAEGGWASLMTQLSQYERIAQQIARMQR